MKDNLLALGMFIGLFFLAFSGLIIPVTLLNDYLIYGSVLFVGFIVSVGYIFYKKNKIPDNIEYLFIPIRSTFCFGCIIVFSFLWVNYFYRNNEYITIKLPVKSFFLDKSYKGGKFQGKRIKTQKSHSY